MTKISELSGDLGLDHAGATWAAPSAKTRKWAEGPDAWRPPRSELVRALKAGEFTAYLQPQVELRACQVVRVEALARWTRPGQEVRAPASFLAAIESHGLMSSLTDAILEDVLRWYAQRERRGAEPIGVAVNVSAANLDEGFVARVGRALDRWQVPPHRLTLEITETAIMQNPSGSAEVLGCLKSLGLQISIDDFGTGYSSLARLHQLPIDEIKIDRGFVRDLREGTDRGMVRSIADLGRNFALRVVAEGVEYEPELMVLAAMGCELAQGFFVSPPVAPDAFETWLTRYRPGHKALVGTDSLSQVPEAAGVTGRPVRRSETYGLGRRLRSLAESVSTDGVLDGTLEGALEGALEQLLGGLAAELGAKFAGCWVHDPEAQQLAPLALWSSVSGAGTSLVEASREVRYAPGCGLPGTVLDADRLVRTTDLDQAPFFLRTTAAREAGCRTAVAFPLRSNDRPVGVLEFLGSGPIPSGTQLDAALRDVGTLVGEFICARRAEQHVASLTQTMVILTGAINRVGCAPATEVPAALCAGVRELTGAHAVVLWQPRRDARALVMTSCCGVELDPLEVSLIEEHSGAAAAFHARQPHFIPNVAHHALPSQRLAAAVQAASALYQPICCGATCLGVLAIAWKRPRTDLPATLRSAVAVLAQSAAPYLSEISSGS